MTTQRTVVELTLESFYEQLEACLGQHPATSEGLLFEERIEREMHEKLASMGRPGWDFVTSSLFFENHGASILIQNINLDWQMILSWLRDQCEAMPPGGVINFEVYDSIQGSMMVGGELIGHWIFTSTNAFMRR